MSSKNKLFLVLLIAAGAMLVFGLIKISGWPLSFTPEPSPFPSAPSLEDMQRVVVGKSVLKFPAVTNKQEISRSLLPQELARFIKSEAENLIVRKVVYENKAKGFEIQYALSRISLMDLDSEFGRTPSANGWQLLMGQRSNLFALREIENSKYQMKISQSVEENNVIAVSIEILSK